MDQKRLAGIVAGEVRKFRREEKGPERETGQEALPGRLRVFLDGLT